MLRVSSTKIGTDYEPHAVTEYSDNYNGSLEEAKLSIYYFV